MNYDVPIERDNRHSKKTETGQEYTNWKQASQEEKYRQILGITGAESPDLIKEKYRELLAKYHPDKVQHLGKEFQEIAEQKTRAIIEAYEFFQKRYNF